MQLKSDPQDPMKSFQKNLQMYLEQKELTLSELAELSDISQSTLRNLVYNEIKDCHISNVIKLAKVLDVSVDELIGCNTLTDRTRQTLRLARQLPKSFEYFMGWIAEYYYKDLYENKVTEKSIPVMTPIVGDNGNLTMTNKFDIVDISKINKSIIPKIFMGIRIPCDLYVPNYFPGDILLIANDRNPKINENLLINIEKNMWIVSKKGNDYHSARDGSYRIGEEHVTIEIGYIAAVINEELL